MKPHFLIFLEKTISQSKIGEIEKKFTRRSRTARSIQKCNKKGHRLKTVLSDFLPEVGPKASGSLYGIKMETNVFNFTRVKLNVFNFTLFFLSIGLDTTETGSCEVSDGMA